MRLNIDQISRFRFELMLIAILILGAFLRIDDLNKESIWVDEAITVKFASSENFIQLIKDNIKEDPYHAPLYYVVMHHWIKIFGGSEFSVRFPSVIFGLLGVFVIYKVGSLLFDKEAGLIASLILAVSQYHVQYSQEARMYSLLALLTLLSFYFFIKLIKDVNSRNLICYIVSSILLLYAHLYGLFFIVAQNIYVLSSLISSNSHKAVFKKWVLLQFVLLVLFVPQGIIDIKLAMGIKGGVYTSASWLPVPSLELIVSTFRDFIGSNLLFLPFFLLMAFSIIPFKNLGNNGTPSHNNKVYLLLLWLVLPISIPYIASKLFVPLFHTRYAIGVSLALFLFVSKGIRDINQKHLKIIIISLIVGVSLSHILDYNETIHKQQWREAMADMESHAEQEDLVLITPDWGRPAFDYYSKRTDMTKINMDSINEQWPTVEKHDRVWFVDGGGGWIDHRIGDYYTESYHQPYLGVQIFLFEKKQE